MKFIILLLNILIINRSIAQDNTENATGKPSGIRLSLNISGDYCYRTIKNDNGDVVSDFIVEIRNKKEKGKTGYTSGLSLIYNLTKRCELETGILLSNKGYQAEVSELGFGDVIDPRRGMTYTTQASVPPSSLQVIYTGYYMDIPIKGNLIFGNKHIRFIASAGVTTNFLIQRTTKVIRRYDDGSKTKALSKSNEYNPINLSPGLGIGIDWNINHSQRIRFEPTFRYGVIDVRNKPIAEYLWNAGLNIGYSFKL